MTPLGSLCRDPRCHPSTLKDREVALSPSLVGGSRQRRGGMEVAAPRSQVTPRRPSPEATQQALPAGTGTGGGGRQRRDGTPAAGG